MSPSTKKHYPIVGGIILLILTCLAVIVTQHIIAHNSIQKTRQPLNEANANSAHSQISPPPTSPVTPASSAESLQGVIYNWPRAGKMVAITFDDGPSKQFTPLYLKALDNYGVHATFFLLGRNVRENSGLSAMITENGDELGCHASTHRNLEQMNIAEAKQGIASARQLIEQDSHLQVFLFRPPGGHLNKALINVIDSMGMKIVLWNIDPNDWCASATPDKIIQNVLARLRPGAIILLHEDKTATLNALPGLIKAIQQRGYQLVTVSELLASQGKQPKEADIQQ